MKNLREFSPRPIVMGFVVASLAGCSSNEPKPIVDPAAADTGLVDSGAADAGSASDAPAAVVCYAGEAYDGVNYAADTADIQRLRTQYAALAKAMKDFEANPSGAPTTATALSDLFSAGTPSLRSITAPILADRVDQLFKLLEQSAPLAFTPAEPPPALGGKYGAYAYTNEGVDIRQAVEKSMYGASFYRAAAALLDAPVTEATVNKLIALFGAHPSFPGDDKDANNPDYLAATYAERRDRKDPAKPGLYLNFKNAAAKAQQAARRGVACNAERDKAIGIMLKSWEAAIAATNIFYLTDAGPKLDAADKTAWSAALHGYGEVLAFTEGFRYVPQKSRLITDVQIDSILTTLRMPPGGTPKAYSFALGTSDSSATFIRAISSTVSIYSFTADDLTTFKTNF